MGEEVPKPTLALEEKLNDFFQEIPTIFTTFQQGIQTKPIRFRYFADAESMGEDIDISYFPFHTVSDLRVKVAMELSKKGRRVDPTQVSLLIPIPPTDDVDLESQINSYISLTILWRPASKDEKYTAPEIIFDNPFQRAIGKLDRNFVNPTTGEIITTIRNDDQSRLLIEEVGYRRLGRDLEMIHVFVISDVINAIPETVPRPFSGSLWAGKLLGYFERSSRETQGNPSAEQQEDTKSYIQYIQYSDRLLVEYEKVLNFYNQEFVKKDVDKYRLHFVGVKYLALQWKKIDEVKDVERLFYELPVTKITPFLRFLPPDGEAITKVLIKSDSTLQKRPDIEPAKLFLDWAGESSATPEVDYLYAKTLYHESSVDEPLNMYGTMRFTADKSATYILVPPKQKRYLESRKHLHEFPRLLQLALKDTPYGSMVPEVHKMSVMCGMRLHTRDRPLNLDILRARVEAMSFMFQEIKPLPGTNALITLRYKLVNNFQTDDRVNQFIKQIEERFDFKDNDKDMREMTQYLMREFGLSFRNAMSRILNFYSNKVDLVPVDMDAKDFVARYNYGIDIVIRSSHPLYTFDIYGLDSESTFKRLLTCLTILFGSRDRDWVPAQRIYLTFNKAAEEVGKALAPEGAAPPKRGLAALLTENDDENESESTSGDGNNDGARYLPGDDENEESTGKPVPDLHEPTAEQALRGTLAPPAPPAAPEVEEPQLVTTEGPAGKKALRAQESKKKASKKADNPLAEYFLKRLKMADETLFVFKTDQGKDYSGLCQANYMKQPLVMNDAQFENLIEKQGKERFVRYGINPDTGEPFTDKAPTTGTYVTVMAYGSSTQNIRYYMCPQYFCYKDELVLFQEDLDSPVDKNRKPKMKDSCPFCGGVIIPKSHKNNPQTKMVGSRLVEETIFDRREFQTTDKKIHDEVGFLRKKAELHPSKKFWIPCCFITPEEKAKRGEDIKPTGKSAAAYEHLYAKAKKPVQAPPKVQPLISYKIALEKPESRYIQGSTKFPLDAFASEGPQIGLLFPKLDEYFQQNPNNMVARDFTKSKLLPNGKGFLRLGVQNGKQYLKDSFFSALAPYLNETSIDGVKKRLSLEITPRIFINLNYGNLMIEFYDPNTPIPEDNDEFTRSQWASDYLGIDDYEKNVEYVDRIMRSFFKFQKYLESPETLKEYRHFAHFLSSPFPISPTTQSRGLLFLVLDYNADQTISVRCPPLGYDDDKHRNCDIGILLHHYTGYWEPIFYVENRISTEKQVAFSRSDLTFQAADEVSTDPQYAWPSILRKRVNEFRTNCLSQLTTSIFTSQSGINPKAMVPFTRAVDALTVKTLNKTTKGDTLFNGIIKDIYNHTVGITIQIVPQQTFIAVPVVDDGKITYFNKSLFLDWDKYPAAPADRVYAFYKEVVATRLPEYPGYRIKYKVHSVAENKIVALQLENGIYIRVGPPSEMSALAELDMIRIPDLKSSMEYEINKSIFYERKDSKGEEKLITMQQNDLEEIYQHLRYTFGNWISDDDPDSKESREKIRDTIDRRDLPLVEKRRRLFLTFGTTVQSWLYQQDYTTKPIETLLRVDCRVQTEDTCEKSSSRCKWRAATDDGEEGFCYLHAPQKGLVGGKEINVLPLFTYRLIDELLRFPEKRKQLMEAGVPGLVKLNDAILLGKNQYIIPENTLAWQDLWRMDWVPTEKEEPRDYEEMSVVPPELGKARIEAEAPPPPPKKKKVKIAADILKSLKDLSVEEVKEEEKKEEEEPAPVAPVRKPRFWKFSKDVEEALAAEREKEKEPAPLVSLAPAPEKPRRTFMISKKVQEALTTAPPPPPPAVVREPTPPPPPAVAESKEEEVEEEPVVRKPVKSLAKLDELFEETVPVPPAAVREPTPRAPAVPESKEDESEAEVEPVVREPTPRAPAVPESKEDESEAEVEPVVREPTPLPPPAAVVRERTPTPLPPPPPPRAKSPSPRAATPVSNASSRSSSPSPSGEAFRTIMVRRASDSPTPASPRASPKAVVETTSGSNEPSGYEETDFI